MRIRQAAAPMTVVNCHSEIQALAEIRDADALFGYLTPPLLAAVSHIDLLRPPREWSPPYDIAAPPGTLTTKAANIRAAVESAAADLALPPADLIPVCLAPGRVYNVTDTLWAALLEREAGADRVRLLRCLDERRRTEIWTLLKRQLASAGRFLVDLPGRWLP